MSLSKTLRTIHILRKSLVGTRPHLAGDGGTPLELLVFLVAGLTLVLRVLLCEGWPPIARDAAEALSVRSHLCALLPQQVARVVIVLLRGQARQTTGQQEVSIVREALNPTIWSFLLVLRLLLD